METVNGKTVETMETGIWGISTVCAVSPFTKG